MWIRYKLRAHLGHKIEFPGNTWGIVGANKVNSWGTRRLCVNEMIEQRMSFEIHIFTFVMVKFNLVSGSVAGFFGSVYVSSEGSTTA